MEGKLAGLGLKNMMVVALFTMIFIVMLKAILTKYQVKGVSEFVQAV